MPPQMPDPGTIKFLVTEVPNLELYTLSLIVIIFAALGGIIGHMYRYEQASDGQLPQLFKIVYSIVTGVATAFLVFAYISKEPIFTLPAIMFASGLIGRMIFQQLIETFQIAFTAVLSRIKG